ncbi:MAG: hypothetical protein B7X37_01835 [Halothiobacillus sp. 14-55-98]|jgi:hypothetical protein|nr:MAG: hypothetical protein B7X37_01835 [Halothiobacillus sp. 14-55-98]
MGTSKNLLNADFRLLRNKLAAARCPMAAYREAGVSPRLAYLFDMSRCSLNAPLAQARGSLHSNMLTRSWRQPVTVFRGTHLNSGQVKSA